MNLGVRLTRESCEEESDDITKQTSSTVFQFFSLETHTRLLSHLDIRVFVVLIMDEWDMYWAGAAAEHWDGNPPVNQYCKGCSSEVRTGMKTDSATF